MKMKGYTTTNTHRLMQLLILILLPLAGLAQSPGSSPEQLEGYLVEAAENNPALRASFQQYLASLEQAPQVKALPDPELAFGYFISPIETRVGPQSLRVGVTQMFPWFGTLEARASAASLQAKARFEEFQETRNHLFYRVKKLWYDLYKSEESIRILGENIKILNSFESLALSRYEAGQVSQVDVLRVQIEKNDLETRLELLRDNHQVLLRTFNELLNRPGIEVRPQVETLALQDIQMDMDSLKQQIYQKNPTLAGLNYEQGSARSNIDAAQKEGMPKFGLGIDYIVTDKRDMIMTDNGKDAAMARIGIQIPLYREKYRAKEQQARIRMHSIREKQSAAENRLVTQLEGALRDYRDAQRRTKLYSEQQIQRTRQAIDILFEQYSTAGSDLEELLRLQRRLLDYQLALETAKVDQNTAVAFIEYLYGKNDLIQKPSDNE